MKNFSLSLTTKREFDLKINALLSDNPHDKHYVHITKKPKKPAHGSFADRLAAKARAIVARYTKSGSARTPGPSGYENVNKQLNKLYSDE